jgi:invasion protein IalB
VRDEVSFTAGYTLRPQSSVAVEIDGKRFSLFVHEDRAYATDAAADRALARAMKAGRAMVVKGVSSRGTQTTDRYSLAGFAAAYQAIERACPRR